MARISTQVVEPEITCKVGDSIKKIARVLAAGRPPCVWGSPGIGKSMVASDVADLLFKEKSNGKRYFIDLRGVQIDPVDVKGLPWVEIDANGERIANWAKPGMLPQPGRDADEGLLLLDEITRAPQLVQNAFLQLVLDRRSGDYEVPPGWRIMAASNREGDGGGVGRMISALANRFVHINVEPDLDDWCKWAVGADVDPVVIAFLRFKPDQLHAFDKQAHSFPTPRSWEMVSDLVKLDDGDQDTERVLVSGAVGQGAAVEFLSFVQMFRNLPSIDAILMNPKQATVYEDPSTLYAVTAALGRRATQENFGRVIEYLDRLPSEWAVYSMRDAVQRDASLTVTPEFTKWAVAHGDII